MSHTQRAALPGPLSIPSRPTAGAYPRAGPAVPLPVTGDLPFPPRSYPRALFLFPSPFSPRFLYPATLHRHAGGDTRGPTQVMHGPPYIFDPLFGLFFPTGSNVRDASLSPSPSPQPCLSFSPRAVARWKDHDCRPVSLSLFLSLLARCATRRGSERTSSVRTGNACYCPSSYRYARERDTPGASRCVTARAQCARTCLLGRYV